MKKVIVLMVLACSVTASAHAGFWSSVAGGVVANSITGSGSGGVYVDKIKERNAAINSYLWNMHETNSYDESYEFYLETLENNIKSSGYDDISMFDTIAWVYKDNGDKSKAIQTYKEKILPWIQIHFKNDKKGENKKFRDKWEAMYREIAEIDETVKIPYKEIEIEEEKTPSVVYGIWGIFVVLTLNLVFNLTGRSRKESSLA